MKKLLITALILLFSMISFAETDTAGIVFPDEVKIGGITTHLNGAGLRKKFIIKVYAAALYLRYPESEAEEILSADEPMMIRMEMIYDGIKPEKLRESWVEGFHANTKDMTGLTGRMETMVSWFTETAHTGDVYDISYDPGSGTTLLINSEEIGTVEGLDFKKALFAVWLGENPADKKLKENMLRK